MKNLSYVLEQLKETRVETAHPAYKMPSENLTVIRMYSVPAKLYKTAKNENNVNDGNE